MVSVLVGGVNFYEHIHLKPIETSVLRETQSWDVVLDLLRLFHSWMTTLRSYTP